MHFWFGTLWIGNENREDRVSFKTELVIDVLGHPNQTELAHMNNRIVFSAVASVFLLFFSVIMLLPTSSLLQDGDTFWHIKTGQWILDHRQFPVFDIFSHSAKGERWIASEWLSEIIFALAFKFSGWRGVVLISAAAISGVIAILCSYLLKHLRFSVAIGWTALTALAISIHFLARPHIFSFLLLLIWVIVIIDAYDRNKFRLPIIPLAIVIIFWSNLHGSVTFGLVLLSIFAAFAFYHELIHRNYTKCRRIFLVVGALTLCAVVNPYGIFQLLLTLDTLKLKFVMAHVSEWRSPDFQEYKVHLLLLITLFAFLLSFGVRVRGPRVVVFGLLLFFALTHIRGLALFFLLSPILLAVPVSMASPLLRPLAIGRTNFSDPVLGFLGRRPLTLPAFLGIATILVTASSWSKIDSGPPESITPTAAIEFIKKSGIDGPVFNEYSFGGYLIFSNVPTFIDSRVPPYTDEFVRRSFNAVNLIDLNDAFALLDEYKIKWVLLEPAQPLARALAQNEQWSNVYYNRYSIVFMRR